MAERADFEMMMKQTLSRYFELNMFDLIRGNIRIEDDGEKIIIYRVDKQGHNPKNYEIGIVY